MSASWEIRRYLKDVLVHWISDDHLIQPLLLKNSTSWYLSVLVARFCWLWYSMIYFYLLALRHVTLILIVFILQLDHGQDLEWLSEMRQVSVLFINMGLPDIPMEAATALQKAFEIISESCTKYKGTSIALWLCSFSHAITFATAVHCLW